MSVSSECITLNNGRKMPILGLGTWKSKAGEVKTAVKAAIATGFRHIDCALCYGNEGEVGEALKEVLAEGKVSREELFVTSKLWNSYHSPNDVKAGIQKSLSNLGLEYLDLYLMHWPHAFKPGEDLFPRNEAGELQYADINPLDTWKAMEKLVDEGLTKSIGMSNFNSVQVQDLIDNGRIKPVVNQVEIHPYLSNDKLVKFCQSKGVAMTAYSPFGAPDRPNLNPNDPLVLENEDIKKLAEKHGKSPAQVVLRWMIQRNISVIPKSVTPSRIQQNAQVFDFQLSSEDMEVMNGLNMNKRMLVPSVERDGKRVMRDTSAPHFPFNIEF